MSYEPTVWKSGDVVTSGKLNKLENAVAQSGGVYIVHDVNGTLDKTWQELYDMMSTHFIMLCSDTENEGVRERICDYVTAMNNAHYVYEVSFNSGTSYICSNSNDYPQIT